MPSFFRKKSGAASASAGDSNSKTKNARAAVAPPASAKKKTNSAADAIKSAFVGDESLLQLHEETATLLRLVKTSSTPAKSLSAVAAMRQRAKNSAASGTGDSATPTKARMTIEVLDDDDDDSDENENESIRTTTTSKQSNKVESSGRIAVSNGGTAAASPLQPASDPFAFLTEEARVRKAADTFYPHTSPSKRAMDEQVGALTHEQLRLERLARNEELERTRRRDEIAHHERHKLPSRLETSAVTIQAHTRGFLCRKHQQHEQEQAAAAAAVAKASEPVDQWHEVRDVERGEIWYYNARTGLSQWDVPRGFMPPTSLPVTTGLASSSSLLGASTQGLSSLPELPAIKSNGGGSGDTSRSAVSFGLQRSASSCGAALGASFELLPPLSPSTSVCSSARSDASDRVATASPSAATAAQQSRADANGRAPSKSSSLTATSPTSASASVTTASAMQAAGRKSLGVGLPVLQPQHRAGSFAVVSVPNPWECDSVMGGSDESLCSQRTRDNFDDDDGDDCDDGTGRSSSPYACDTDGFARRRSVLDRHSDDDGDDGGDSECADDVAGDWQINDSLFLADGSRNSKLRDTIRNALHVSKFDSISTLIASNVVLRKKPVKTRRRGGEPAPQDATSPMRAATYGNQRSGGKRAVSREIVLGKRDAPMFVAVLSNDKSKLQASPNARSSGSGGGGSSGTKDSPLRSVSKKSCTRGFGSANPLASPPRIRDLADPGFHEDDDRGGNQHQQQQHTRRNHSDARAGVSGEADGDSRSRGGSAAPRKAPSAAVCFNCWSSSSGRFCEIHADPNAGRKVKAAESALMCANWDLDQLRRKYRAEEIQEVFMRQSASLRYDKKLKQYVTVIECRHPIYRNVDELLVRWNKTMRRKLRTRAWFRSLMEQLRAGRVPKAADTQAPALLKLKNTLQNNRWCTAYSNSVRAFHPVAPVTCKNQSGTPTPIPDVIMVHPARPQLRHWVLVTEYTKPLELYRPRMYELPPRRCVPMPTPSFLEDIPLPVPNVHIDCGHIASWLERLCARVSSAALAKAALQIHACSPPRGFNEPRRTKHVTPLTVMFATFGRKPTPGNVAVGGLSAELLIHMLVTTYVPAQFGNFIVFDRRAIAPALTKDHGATYACLAVATTDPLYVFRALEHALNVRRAPCIVLAARAYAGETELAARTENKRFPLNRPEQTGEELAHGFRTFWLVDAFTVRDDVASVLVQPNSDVLSPNTTSLNTTLTTHVDRFYPFCIPTTKENTPIEFIHLLWIGQSSRNQPQVFTTLGAQQPGEFMKNSDPHGALGVCTTVIYRSWAFMQSSPVEEFVTPDGVAYWYDKQSGETFWTRPLLPAEQHRGKDGDIDGVVVDGIGEVATRGVGADDDAKYPQQAVRKYMTKTMEAPEEKDRRVQRVTASAKKYDIVIDLSGRGDGEQRAHANAASSPSQRKVLEKIQVPQLALKRGDRTRQSKRAASSSSSSGPLASSPVKQTQQLGGSSTKEEHGGRAAAAAGNASGGAVSSLDSNTKQLIESITQALGTAMPGGAAGGVDMLQLGIGLGMGLGLRSQQQQQQQSEEAVASSRSLRSDRLRAQQSTRGIGVGGSGSFDGTNLDQHDEQDDEDEDDDESNADDMSTSRSDASSDSDGSLSARSTTSTAMSVDITLPPDEQELYGSSPSRIPPPGHMAKTPGYQTHAPPGKGSSWLSKSVDASSESQTAVAGFAGAVHQRVACLPKDFVAAVTSTKTCKMQANYLPVIKNTNEPRNVGVVWPRGALQEWLPTGYSPWSAGRSVFGTQFIQDLMQRPELVDQMNAAAAGATGGGGAAVTAKATGAHVEKREKVTQAMKESQQLEEIFSHCRHGKYDDVELSLNNPDWTLSIDAKDAMGNTLLSIACQNNNKRIAKLCLRRGADINTQNLNGQTVLHYCHEYGFHDLLEYLMDKGARDDVLNADGLTCYEGLNKEAVDAL